MGVCQQTQWTTDAKLMLWRSKVLFVYRKFLKSLPSTVFVYRKSAIIQKYLIMEPPEK